MCVLDKTTAMPLTHFSNGTSGSGKPTNPDHDQLQSIIFAASQYYAEHLKAYSLLIHQTCVHNVLPSMGTALRVT